MKRTEFLELPSLADKFAGTPTRYTPPRCSDQDPYVYPDGTSNAPNPCSHSDDYHRPSGAARSEMAGFVGLRYSKRTGAFSWPKSAPIKFTPGKLPDRTLENIAACAALGLSFWAEAGSSRGVWNAWAVDDDQRVHMVKIDYTARKATHECLSTARYDPVRQWPRDDSKKRCEGFILAADYDVEDTRASLFDHEEDPMPTATTSPFGRAMKPSTPQAGFGGNLTAAEKRERKKRREKQEADRDAEMAELAAATAAKVAAMTDEELAAYRAETSRKMAEANVAVAVAKAKMSPTKPPPGMTMAAAIALLHHDPDHLGDIPTEHLHAILLTPGEKAYHAKIRKELKRR